jgi:hypothetical protein
MDPHAIIQTQGCLEELQQDGMAENTALFVTVNVSTRTCTFIHRLHSITAAV